MSVNGSIRALNSDVGELFAKVGLAMTEISNVTTVVEGLTNFLQTKMTSSLPATAAVEGGKVSETPRSTTTQPASTEPAPPSGDSGPNAQSLGELFKKQFFVVVATARPCLCAAWVGYSVAIINESITLLRYQRCQCLSLSLHLRSFMSCMY